MQHIKQVFSSKIAGSSWRVGTAAQTTDGRIDDVDTHLQGHQDIGQSSAACVVEMHGQLRKRDLSLVEQQAEHIKWTDSH